MMAAQDQFNRDYAEAHRRPPDYDLAMSDSTANIPLEDGQSWDYSQENTVDLDGAKVRSDLVIDGMWQPSSEGNFRSWAEVLARDSRELIAEIDRLRAENGRLQEVDRLTVCHNLGCMVVFHASDKCPACNDEPERGVVS